MKPSSNGSDESSSSTSSCPRCGRPARRLTGLPGPYGTSAVFCSLQCAAKVGFKMVWLSSALRDGGSAEPTTET